MSLVVVTGGTGFVGAHTTAALLRRAHRVRLLVREPDRVAPALAPLGIGPSRVDIRVGDVTDEIAVADAVRGAEAVLHAASVYSFDSRRRGEMRRTNVRGTEVVLEAAVRAGVARIVHVSTVGALFPAEAPIGPGSPVGRPKETYLATKAESEVVARGFQERGAPVAITYPPALIGPHDPHVGDQNTRLRNVLRGLMPMWPSGGLPIGDVRDTAELHAELLSAPETSGNRFFGPGHFLTTREFMATVREATGRALPALFLPPWSMAPVGRLTGVLQRVWPWHIPAEYGAIHVCAVAKPVEDGAPSAGVAARPAGETVTDTVRWLHRSGLLSDRQAGRRIAEREGIPA